MDVAFYLYIPVNGEIRPLMTSIKAFKLKVSSTLSGLVHKGISLVLHETFNINGISALDKVSTNSNVDPTKESPNTKASKIFLYLMNPCFIYAGTEVTGDAILQVTIHSNSQYASKFTSTDRAYHVAKVLKIMKKIYKNKHVGKIPSDLESWCTKRLKDIEVKIKEMENQKKDISSITKSKDHLLESMSSYGKVKILSSYTSPTVVGEDTLSQKK